MSTQKRPRVHPILRSAGATGAALAVAVVGSSAASATPRESSPAPTASSSAADTAPLGSVSPSTLPQLPEPRHHGRHLGRTVLTYAVLDDNTVRRL